MKKNISVITPGHKYELPNYEDQGIAGQTLQFIEKAPKEDGEFGELETLNDGTTNEDVLDVLIDRLSFLDEKFPCPENKDAIAHLEKALAALNKRTAERKARGVEGKHTA